MKARWSFAAGAALMALIFAAIAATRSGSPPPAVRAAAPAPSNPAIPFTPAPTVAAASPDSVTRTSPALLRDALASGRVQAIDVRDIDAYVASHIPGALHIPLSYIEGEIPYIDRSRPIVTYCT